MNADTLIAALHRGANGEKACVLRRFFKTGPGQYGEGDKFLGVTVPQQREVVRAWWSEMGKCDCLELLGMADEMLRSEFHEVRLTGLLILVEGYRRGSQEDRQRIYDFYLDRLDRVNNWDLVDLSAPSIVGEHLLERDASVLYRLARSGHLWSRRVSVVATLAFIRQRRHTETLNLARLILLERGERHDLMHKAAGWMLREVGKRDEAVLREFLDEHASRMPRTALRYAIERFDAPTRQAYLAAGK